MLYNIPPKNPYGKQDLAFWEGFLTQEEMNQILAYPQWLTAQKASIGGSGGDSEINDTVRASSVSWLPMAQETAWLYDKLSYVISEVNSRFFHYDITGFHEMIQLGIYSASDKGHYSWHTDATPSDRGVPRKLSMALLLSDRSEFVGGDLEVKTDSDEPKTLETVKGRAWFFPSYVLHRVTPVTSGIRRSLVVWVGGPPFK